MGSWLHPNFLTHEHVYFTSLDNDRGPISSAFFERDSMNEISFLFHFKKDYSEKKNKVGMLQGYC